MSSKRVLVVAADVLPLPGLPTTGAGLRSWALGKGLETRGHEVIFSMPQIFTDSSREAPNDVAVHAWTPDNLDSVVASVDPDVAVFCHWPALCVERKLEIPTVLDFHGPHILERVFQDHGHLETNAREKITAISKADFFTCAGEKQKYYFLAWLLMAGVDVTADVATDVIAPIPVSMSPELPTHEWSDSEPVFVYGGVFLPWQDPSLGLRLTVEAMERAGHGTLKFFGGKHPGHRIGKLEAFEQRVDQLIHSPRVEMPGLVPHDDLIDIYRRADVALDLMAQNHERELAFTTRTVEYLWCGLPVIYQDYAELATYIREYEAGWTVDPADEAQVRQAIEQALNDPTERRRRGENAQQLVRERLTWDQTIERLDAFCRDPWKREPSDLPGWIAGDPRQVTPSRAAAQKGIGDLIGEARTHYQHGGVRRVAYYTLGFLQKQVSQRGDDKA